MSLFHLTQKVVRAEGRDIFATVSGEEATSYSAPGRGTQSASGKEAPLPIVLTLTAPCSYTLCVTIYISALQKRYFIKPQSSHNSS